MGLQQRLRGAYMGAPDCKAVLDSKLSKSREKRAQKWRFFENYEVQMLNFCLLTPKRLQGPELWAVGRTRKKEAISRIRGKDTPSGIMTKFCMSVDIQDVITCATFCLGVARGRISLFFIDLRRRPYNTLALPYSRIITDFFAAAINCI